MIRFQFTIDISLFGDFLSTNLTAVVHRARELPKCTGKCFGSLETSAGQTNHTSDEKPPDQNGTKNFFDAL
jgi:hypothetical protein